MSDAAGNDESLLTDQEQVEEEEVEDVAAPPTVAPKKSSLRGDSNANRSLYTQFFKLDERLISPSTGIASRHWLCVCSYCKIHFDAVVARAPSFLPFPPKKITRTNRDCDNHLKLFLYYNNQCKRARHTNQKPSLPSPTSLVVSVPHRQ